MIASFENCTERVARLLSQKYGITVIFRDNDCSVEGNVIYLPALPSTASLEIHSALRGFLDHEIGHILFSDSVQDIERELRKKKIPSKDFNDAFMAVNLVEDRYIERELRKKWPGSTENLASSYDYLNAKIRRDWPKLSKYKQVVVGLIMSLSDYDPDAFNDLYSKEVAAIIREGHSLFFDRVQQVNRTKDSVDVGYDLYLFLKERVPNESTTSEESEDLETEDKDSTKEENKVETSAEQNPANSEAKDFFSEALGDYISEEVTKEKSEKAYSHNQASDDTYLVYSTEYDTINRPVLKDVARARVHLSAIRDKTESYTKVVQRRLVNSLIASQKNYWLGGVDHGKLDTRRLYRCKTGSKALYKRRIETPKLNTCVGVLVDHSSSMGGFPLDLCKNLSVVLGDAFSALRIPFFIAGYSTNPYIHIPPSVALSAYARWCGLHIDLYSDFQDNWMETAPAITQMSVQANTLEGESILWAARKLLNREEARKLLIVLSDGYPFPGKGHIGRCQQYFTKVVASITNQTSIDLVGFGIRTDSVRYYFKDYAVLNQLSDVVQKPLDYVVKYLTKGILDGRK